MRSEVTEITAGKSAEIYSSVLETITRYQSPHRFVGEAYGCYLQRYRNNPSVNGRIFEYLVCETLVREGVTPFYFQAKFALVPNADFDVVLYHPKQPVVLSMKVSLRERYKQADLEGMALRQVYRNAKSYLITLSPDEAHGVSEKIDEGEVVGLTDCVLANSPKFTALLSALKAQQFDHAHDITPLTGMVFPTPPA